MSGGEIWSGAGIWRVIWSALRDVGRRGGRTWSARGCGGGLASWRERWRWRARASGYRVGLCRGRWWSGWTRGSIRDRARDRDRGLSRGRCGLSGLSDGTRRGASYGGRGQHDLAGACSGLLRREWGFR